MNTCRECGQKITKGSLCDNCKMRIALELKKSLKKSSDEHATLETLKQHKGFYTAHLTQK